MSGIRFIKLKNIDRQKWDACISECQDAQIYGYSWYLNAITDHQWNALVLNDYEAVFPLPFKTKFGISIVYQPFFCQQLGLFAKPGIDISLQAFLRLIPLRYLKVHLQLRNFRNEVTNLPTRVNYILSLAKEYESIASGYSADCRKNLRKISEESIEYRTTVEYQSAIELYKEVWGPLNPHVKNAHYGLFLNACSEALKRNMLECMEAYKDGEMIGRAVFLKNEHYLHYVCAAPTQTGRKHGIMHGIIDHMIRKYAGETLFLDFEGSENENVAVFYRKFGPVRADYLVFDKGPK